MKKVCQGCGRLEEKLNKKNECIRCENRREIVIPLIKDRKNTKEG